MDKAESTFRGVGGVELYVQALRPEGRPRAVLAIQHGFGEHSGRYQNVFDHFVPHGFDACAYDLRGHGRSPGKRGFIRDWGDYRGDCQAFLEWARAREPGLPIFLYGHSLGGLIALDLGLHGARVNGVIASGPLLGSPGIPRILMQISKVLSAVWPSFSMRTGLDPQAISRDPAAVRAYVEDPLVHSIGTARLGTELTRAIEWVHAHAGEWSLPLLIVHGSDDRLAPPAESLRFFEHAGGTDKKRIEVPGGFHEPHNDVDKATVFAEIERWLGEHLAS